MTFGAKPHDVTPIFSIIPAMVMRLDRTRTAAVLADGRASELAGPESHADGVAGEHMEACFRAVVPSVERVGSLKLSAVLFAIVGLTVSLLRRSSGWRPRVHPCICRLLFAVCFFVGTVVGEFARFTRRTSPKRLPRFPEPELIG
jgi:hypothetical protein